MQRHLSIAGLTGQTMGLPQDRQKLQARKFPGRFYVRTIEAHYAKGVAGGDRPFLSGNKIRAPKRSKAKLLRAIAQERDVSSANAVGEFNNDLLLLAADALNIRPVIRHIADRGRRSALKQTLQLPAAPASRGAPSDLAHQRKRRFLADNSKNVSQRPQSECCDSN